MTTLTLAKSKRSRRQILCICKNCLGTGRDRGVTCAICDGSGSVLRWVVEVYTACTEAAECVTAGEETEA